MHQNPDDSFNVWKKNPAVTLKQSNAGWQINCCEYWGGGGIQHNTFLFFAFCISLPDKSIKRAINAKLNSLLPKGTRNCDA